MIAKIWAWLCRLTLIAACGLIALAVVMMAIRFPYPALAFAFLLLWRMTRRGGVSDAYGSARVSTTADLIRQKMLGSSGLILGRNLPEDTPKLMSVIGLFSPSVASVDACLNLLSAFCGRRWNAGRFIRLDRFVHLAAFAPAGGGKSVGLLIPILRSFICSCVTTDPKGELGKLTGKHRSRKLRHKAIYLNPYGLHGLPTSTLNPLDRRFLNPDSDTFLDDCRVIANSLVFRKGTETEPHWNDMCELVLTAAIAFVVACEPDPKNRTFETVRMLVSSITAFDRMAAVMQQTNSHHGVLKRLGAQLSMAQDREKMSVLTTVQRNTNFLDSPVIARNTASSSFDPMSLRKKATVYLIIPSDKLTTLAPLQRLWLTTIIKRITAGTPSEKNPVLFLLDELGHLGDIPVISNSFTLLRGMGIRIWAFLQDRGQMRTTFGEKADTILGNMQTQIYFNINSYETAEEVSKRAGETTIRTRTSSDSRSHSRSGGGPNAAASDSSSSSSTVNTQEIARKLLKPEEILTLPEDTMLIFHKNLSVIPARLCRYFKAPEFRFGGTGKQAGVGLAAGLMAASLLLLSLLAADAAQSVAGLSDHQLDGYAESARAAGGFGQPTLDLRMPTPRR